MIEIKEEFKKLIPPLTVEEFKQLEQNCLDEGIREKIITWNGFIIDGHNRYEIATRWNLDYKTESKHFENEEQAKDWMDANQLGRRNLTADQRKILIGRRYNREKKQHGGNRKSSDQNDHMKTSERLAKENNISAPSVRRYGKDAEKFEEIKEKQPELANKIWSGEKTLTDIKKEEKKILTEEKKEEQKKIIESITNIKLKDIETTIEKGWYKVGKQFLYFGSNTDKEFIDKLPKAKFAFADPPYNAGVDKWDFDFKWELDYLENYADVVAVTPGGWNACNFYKETNMNYIWEMFCWITNGMTHGKCGYANVIKTSIFGKVKPKISQDFWKINIDISKTEDTKHKGRKPYDFMIHLIDLFTNENDIVIDVFGGSGTTMLMCEQMNRISYNAEIDKQYCIDIIKRIGNYERI
jgi:16S rRNA G966 N2-methylase RsmD